MLEVCNLLKMAGEPCKPDCPGRVANTQLVWVQSPMTVNDVNTGIVGRFCVTRASQSALPLPTQAFAAGFSVSSQSLYCQAPAIVATIKMPR
jgi:hypothetical protein